MEVCLEEERWRKSEEWRIDWEEVATMLRLGRFGPYEFSTMQGSVKFRESLGILYNRVPRDYRSFTFSFHIFFGLGRFECIISTPVRFLF